MYGQPFAAANNNSYISMTPSSSHKIQYRNTEANAIHAHTQKIKLKSYTHHIHMLYYSQQFTYKTLDPYSEAVQFFVYSKNIHQSSFLAHKVSRMVKKTHGQTKTNALFIQPSRIKEDNLYIYFYRTGLLWFQVECRC